MMCTPAGEGVDEKLLPVSIGIEVYGGFMRKIIKKGTVIPAVTSVCLTTKFHRQPAAVIRVFAGERPRVKDNIILTEKSFCPVPNFASGTGKLQAWVHVDIVEGKVEVTCKCGLANEPEDSWHQVHVEMSREDLNTTCKEMKRFEEEDRKEWDRLDKLWTFREWCVDLEDMFSRRLAKRLEEDTEIPELLGHVRQTLDWLATATESSAQVLTERRYELEDLVVPKLEYLLDNKVMDDFGNEIPTESDHSLLEDGMQNLLLDPVILPQDPIISAQDPIISAQDPIISAQDSIISAQDPIISPQDPIISPQDPIRSQDYGNAHQPDKEISFGIFDGQPCLEVKLLTRDFQSSAGQEGPQNELGPVVDGGANLDFMNVDTDSVGSPSAIADSVDSDICGRDTKEFVSENVMVEFKTVID